MSIPTLPRGTAYTGPIGCDFCINGNTIKVRLRTEDLYLRSVKEKDIPRYVNLWGDSEVMKNFASGATKTPEATEQRVRDSYIPRWENGNPFSAFAVFLVNPTEFIGNIVLGGGVYEGFDDNADAGYSEMSGFGYPKYWGQGLGKEAAAAIVKGYAPELKKRGYKVPTDVEGGVENRSFDWISATARIDKDEGDEFYNEGSIKVLTGLGFQCLNTSNKFGNFRGHFGIKV